MKLTINMNRGEKGMFVVNEKAAARHQKQETGKNRSTVFAGGLNQKPDLIMKKKEQAQKQAMKMLSDVFDTDKKVDQSLSGMEEEIGRRNEETLASLDEYNEIQKERESLSKQLDSADGEERGKMETQLKELDERAKRCLADVEANRNAVKGMYDARQDISQERAKKHLMVDAGKESEMLMLNASKEMAWDLINEAKDHVEEKMEEVKEKAEERTEKKEEEKERLEKAKEKAEESEPAADGKDIEILSSYNENKPKIDKELEEIMEENKLILEDLKGAAVDANL